MPDLQTRIAGCSWVTPLGAGTDEVWRRLLAGEQAAPQSLASSAGGPSHPVYRVPPEAIANAPRHPRLRRASNISRFAVVAGLGALQEAGVSLNPETAARTAIIFAISNGGVIYTRRFYEDVVASGAQAASPLLFPETVFNAPASHLAAILGITGASYTLVGDGAVGLLALQMAEQLLQNNQLDRCLVVGAEEADWLLCDAYRRWRLLAQSPPARVFADTARGFVLSEGAGAVLLARDGDLVIERIDPGCNFSRRKDIEPCLEKILRRLALEESDVLVASANGTFIDRAELGARRAVAPHIPVYPPKAALGDSIGASALWQVVSAVQILQTQKIPPVPGLEEARETGAERVVVSSCGMNQQIAGLAMRRA